MMLLNLSRKLSNIMTLGWFLLILLDKVVREKDELRDFNSQLKREESF